MKKVFAFILVCSMVCGICVSGFADGYEVLGVVYTASNSAALSDTIAEFNSYSVATMYYLCHQFLDEGLISGYAIGVDRSASSMGSSIIGYCVDDDFFTMANGTFVFTMITDSNYIANTIAELIVELDVSEFGVYLIQVD